MQIFWLFLISLTKHYASCNKQAEMYSAFNTEGSKSDFKPQKDRITSKILGIKSQLDQFVAGDNTKTYRAITLGNNMQLMLISDPTTKYAAASMGINVGTNNDPQGVPGMAHFLSNILYHGTQEYPDYEDMLFGFTHLLGGNINTRTGFDRTTHHFVIPEVSLQCVLDRFSQMFIAPLLGQIRIDAEIPVVRSQCEMSRTMECFRALSMTTMPADPNHHVRKHACNSEPFGTSAVKLNLSLVEEVQFFFEKFYVASRMSLVVYGRQPLEQLAQMVVPLFLPVKPGNVTSGSLADDNPQIEHPYQHPNHSGFTTRYVPFADSYDNYLWVYFAMPDFSGPQNVKPMDYISKFLNDQSLGSFKSTLEDQNLVSSLRASYDLVMKGIGRFDIMFDLTDKGLANVDKILYIMFAYAKYLNDSLGQLWIWKEIKEDGKIASELGMSPEELVQSLSDRMAYQTGENVLRNETENPRDQMNRLRIALTYLRLDNFNYVVGSKTFEGETDKVERWTKAKYHMEKISQKTMEYLANAYLNESIIRLLTSKSNKVFNENATHLEALKPSTLNHCDSDPQLTIDNEENRLWFYCTTAENVVANFLIKIPSHYASKIPILAKVISKETDHQQRSKYLPSGFTLSINENSRGITMETAGPQTKIVEFLQKTFEIFLKTGTDNATFENAKRKLVVDRKSMLYEPSADVAWSLVKQMMEFSPGTQSLSWANDLEALTLEDFNSIRSQAFSKIFIESLIFGNLENKEAVAIFNKAVKLFKTALCSKPLKPVDMMLNRAINIPTNSSYVYGKILPIQRETGVAICFQSAAFNDRDFLIMIMLAHVMNPQFHVELRIKEGIAYIVEIIPHRANNVNALCFLVQGNHSAYFLDDRVEAFISTMKDSLQAIGYYAFLGMKSVCLKKVLQSTQDMWQEVANGDYFFARKTYYNTTMNMVMLDDLIYFVEEVLGRKSALRKKFAVFMHTVESELESASQYRNNYTVKLVAPPTFIEDIDAFKNFMPLYPALMPN